LAKKSTQNFPALFAQNSCGYVHLMIKPFILEDIV